MTGEKLQQARKRLFTEHPLCCYCLKEGRVTAASIRDHIVPLQEGGSEDDSNVQALCKSCHDIKTHEESQRGKQSSGAIEKTSGETKIALA